MNAQKYVLAIDQSTSGTKALLFDRLGALVARYDTVHRQIVNEHGWVEHDGQEIYQNTILTVKQLLAENNVPQDAVVAAGISNQRETGIMWTRDGKPIYNAIVWQCARGAALCESIEAKGHGTAVKDKTGLRLSPYFTAAKFGWLMDNVPEARKAYENKQLLAGTMDAWLLYRLTGNHATDYSNASRTQLFNIHTLKWDEELCQWFGVPYEILPQVCPSDGYFGESTFEGAFEKPIPVRGVMGDSHAALFAQGCITAGHGKATYGTGSSVMINTGSRAVCDNTLVTSLAWGIGGRVDYVLEGNINYTGAVISWLKDSLGIISSAREAESLARSVPDTGGVYLVPAYSGLGAPYWNSEARAMICGMSRTTGKAHIVRAAEECIAYQITDVVKAAQRAGVDLHALRTDGGPTRDSFLMQFQTDLIRLPVDASRMEELSGAGVAFAAGLSAGLYTENTLNQSRAAVRYKTQMPQNQAQALYDGWQKAVALVLSETDAGSK